MASPVLVALVGTRSIELALYDQRLVRRWVQPSGSAELLEWTLSEVGERFQAGGLAVVGPSERSARRASGAIRGRIEARLGWPVHAPSARKVRARALRSPLPRHLGLERAARCSAAWRAHRSALVVVGIGPRIEVDVISGRGEHLGAIAAPGPVDASPWPSPRRRHPPTALETTPYGEQESAFWFGCVGLVESLVARARAELPRPARVIVTGEGGRDVASASPAIDAFVPDLAARGLARLAADERAQTAGGSDIRAAVRAGARRSFPLALRRESVPAGPARGAVGRRSRGRPSSPEEPPSRADPAPNPTRRVRVDADAAPPWLDPGPHHRLRAAAAAGALPLPPRAAVVLQFELMCRDDAAAAQAAEASLSALPPEVARAVLSDETMPPVVLAHLARVHRDRDDYLQPLLLNPALPADVVPELAESCSREMAETIASHHVKLLERPAIALYLLRNPNVPRSTQHRVLEFLVREGVSLPSPEFVRVRRKLGFEGLCTPESSRVRRSA